MVVIYSTITHIVCCINCGKLTSPGNSCPVVCSCNLFDVCFFLVLSGRCIPLCCMPVPWTSSFQTRREGHPAVSTHSLSPETVKVFAEVFWNSTSFAKTVDIGQTVVSHFQSVFVMKIFSNKKYLWLIFCSLLMHDNYSIISQCLSVPKYWTSTINAGDKKVLEEGKRNGNPSKWEVRSPATLYCTFS